MNQSHSRLAAIRSSMKERNVDLYIIPDTDPHISEYVPGYWRITQWLTGFSGSASTVVITDSFAGLWTDSRYTIQAERELGDSGFTLIKPDPGNSNDTFRWIAKNIRQGGTLGFDGKTFQAARLRRLEQSLTGRNVKIDSDCDLISEIWTDRPPLPESKAFDHPVSYCGKERALKIKEVRESMKTAGANHYLVTSPDEIMWLLNIRGRDVPYSPLLLCFAIVGMDQILLLVDEGKIPFSLAREFDNLGIVILPYEETEGMLAALEEDTSIIVTPSSTSVSIYNAVPSNVRKIEETNIITLLKAVRNRTEIENTEKVMIRDGVALTKFFFNLEMNSGSRDLNELSLTDDLIKFRSEQENYICPSFAPIVAFNDHAALPHYNASPETNAAIGSEGILLVDSGSQYLDGTTDITRTIALGTPSSKQRKDFTLVLRGMINLAMAKFPAGSTGNQIDILARKALWEHGLNYGHGTGHGVGFCLNVHEGPQSISPVHRPDNIIKPGMLISDEPAIYRQGEYGIRTENLILCYEDEETEFGKFLRFETISLCYIDQSLIDYSMLSEDERDWLNSYHSIVYEKLSAFVTPEEKKWLREKTLPH